MGKLAALVAVVAALLALVLVRLARRRRTSTSPSRLHRPGDTDLFQKMESLGIPLESGRGGTHAAGTAKTRLYQHVRAIENRNWQEAVDGLSDTIDLLSKQSDARWGDVLGVAYRLRARAHEGAGRRTEARADYERALAFTPDDRESREGHERTSG